MLLFLSRRLLLMVPLIFGITLITFTVIHLAPGGPVEVETEMSLKASAQARENLSSEWLFKKFAIQLGVKDLKEDEVELLTQIYKRLYEINDDGKRAIVMIDEVQMLNSKEIMEEFRGLLNMETPEGKLLNFVFFGLPDLEDVLSLDGPLKQRVAVKIRLKEFSENDTKDYIKHRLGVAGCPKEIFSDEAIKLIYEYTNGVPRLINTVCDNALLDGYLSKVHAIDGRAVQSVAVDLGLSTAVLPAVPEVASYSLTGIAFDDDGNGWAIANRHGNATTPESHGILLAYDGNVHNEWRLRGWKWNRLRQRSFGLFANLR